MRGEAAGGIRPGVPFDVAMSSNPMIIKSLTAGCTDDGGEGSQKSVHMATVGRTPAPGFRVASPGQLSLRDALTHRHRFRRKLAVALPLDLANGLGLW